jgi:hypothetical protein
MGFRELLREQLSAACDAAEADEMLTDVQLGEWWRWRVLDLERYTDDMGPARAE